MCNNIKTITRLGANWLTSGEKYGIIISPINKDLTKECECMNWWSIIFWGAIPVLTVAAVFFIKRKLLWISPLVSTALAVAYSAIEMPTIISYGEHRAMFFILVMPRHIVIGIILTVIAYLVAHSLKRKQK